MPEIVRLLWGTIQLRPYVFTFLLVYIIAASFHIGWRRALLYIPLGYSLAWMSEFASIHWGFPYGDYYYIPLTENRELWVFGVPFMDSLSYVFLSYCSYATAIFILSPVAFRSAVPYVLETRTIRRSWQTLLLGSFLFVLLDIIIDPVALQGHRWFLGQIYGYRIIGTYFGIPFSNFGGWLVVGLVLVGTLQLLDRWTAIEPEAPSSSAPFQGLGAIGPLLYVSVLIFNLSITFWIGEDLLGLVGCLVLLFPFLIVVFFTLYKHQHISAEAIERHLFDFPNQRSRQLIFGDIHTNCRQHTD